MIEKLMRKRDLAIFAILSLIIPIKDKNKSDKILNKGIIEVSNVFS